jgi:hypothetical protein
MLVCASHYIIAHETAGAASTRHSLLPLVGGKVHASLGRVMRRENADLRAHKDLYAVIPKEYKNLLLFSYILLYLHDFSMKLLAFRPFQTKLRT